MKARPTDHQFIKESIAGALPHLSKAEADRVADVVLRTLDQQKMISYAEATDIPLLTTHGRVLVAIMEDPGITLRALSVYLGLTESNVQKSIQALIGKGLIAMTKLPGERRGKFSPSGAFAHPDITRLFDATIAEILRQRNSGDNEEQEDSPF